ncbi:MAG: PEP-CTERM sorting domain-containing protein [Terrimicrobiaceae bacterium]|nr:PEP-CTERM sorting domain-containing protein [Terrimicrobiaceae bacterium]
MCGSNKKRQLLTTSGSLLLRSSSLQPIHWSRALSRREAAQNTGKTSINAGTLVLAPEATIDNSSEIIVGTADEQGTLDVSAKSDFSIGSGQRLSGYGTVNLGEGKTLTIYGILSPGNSPGVTSVIGDAELDAISTTLMELAGIGGVAGVDFDQFEVSGLLTYGGDLSIQGFSGYDITQTAVYQLFDFAQENGDFNSVIVGTTGLVLDNGIWSGSDAMANYTFSQASGIFTVASVPEPEAVALIGFSVVVLLLRRRHSRPFQTEVCGSASEQ